MARSVPAASRRSPARSRSSGFDSLFITDHLLVGKRFYSVNWLEPLTTLAVAAGATERVRLGTSILIMPLRNPVILAKELATLQFLSDDRVILGAGVGWNDVEYEAVGVKKSERGKRTDEMLDIMMPLLEGETVTYHGEFYSVDDVLDRAAVGPAAAALDRRRLAAGRRPSRRTSRSSSSRSRPDRPGGRLDPAAHLPAAGHRPRLGGAPGRDARGGQGPADTLVAHENFLHLVMTNDPVEARRAAARGVPQGDERRARPGVPRVGLPVRDARRDHRLAPGPRGCRRRVLLPAHDDARPGPAPAVGRRDHPERRLPGDGRAGPPPADPLVR